MWKWTSTGRYGLRYREHATKTVGVGRSKRPLRYYTAVYKHDGKVITDAYGWEGLDFHNEDDIAQTALQLRTNRRNKVQPFTLRELLDERQQALNEEQERVRQEKANVALEEQTRLDNVFDFIAPTTPTRRASETRRAITGTGSSPTSVRSGSTRLSCSTLSASAKRWQHQEKPLGQSST